MSVSKLKISLIIPTHNREQSLKRLLDNIFSLKSNVNFEIVIVDNNSSDRTASLVKSFNQNIKYVFEGNTSFTKARHTGAQNATGDIFVYLDDDVILSTGTLEEVEKLFLENSDCGVAGGKILPLFENEPPDWIFALQKSFNGFSLYDLGEKVLEVGGIPGPCMAIRRSAYEKVGGFPPDTLGVETNTGKKTFKKLYVGPGDYGFCLLCKNAGFKVLYSPNIKVHHVIPPVRLTKEFWISRMVGEGHCAAISKKNLSQYPVEDSNKLKDRCKLLFNSVKYFLRSKISRFKNKKSDLLPDEIWFEYYRSFRKMNLVLNKNSGLAEYLWKLGFDGVADKDFDSVLQKFPKDYKKLVL